MGLKVILVISLLFSVPFFCSVPASGASPSSLGQFVLGMDYARVKELLNQNGIEVVLGEPSSRKELRKKAHLTTKGEYGDQRFLYFVSFQSEFGWFRDQSGYTLAFGPSGQLEGVMLLLFTWSKKDVEGLRAIESWLYTDLDRKFQRVSGPEGDRVSSDSSNPSNSSFLRKWVASDGQGRPLRVNAYQQGKKQLWLSLYIGQGLEAIVPLAGSMSRGETANATEGEATQAQPPQTIDPQPSEETKKADSALTNEDVVRVAASGMGDELLIQVIETSSVRFTVTPDALVELKKSGLSDRVIAAMLSRAKGGQ